MYVKSADCRLVLEKALEKLENSAQLRVWLVGAEG